MIKEFVQNGCRFMASVKNTDALLNQSAGLDIQNRKKKGDSYE